MPPNKGFHPTPLVRPVSDGTARQAKAKVQLSEGLALFDLGAVIPSYQRLLKHQIGP